MLTLPIKKQWFLMIRSGEKTEEYRNPTPYWHIRFETLFGETVDQAIRLKHKAWVRFRNGYGPESPTISALISLSYGTGFEEWGAKKGELYFILHIHKVKEVSP